MPRIAADTRWALGLVILAVIFAAGCSGRQQTASPLDNPGPVSFSGLPSPASLYHVGSEGTNREASTPHSEYRLGDQDYAKATNCVENSSDHTQLLIAGPSSPGWAMYYFHRLADADTVNQATLELADSLPGTCYVGLADFDSGAWVWRTVAAPAASNTLVYPATGRFMNPDGFAFVVVAVWDDTAKVARLTLDSEQNDLAPVARLSSTPSQANQTLDAVLDASATENRNGGVITGYEWDFDGDGTYDETTTVPTAGHIYDGLGIYYPVVRVTDDDGLTDTDTTKLEVQGWSHSFGDDQINYYQGVARHPALDCIYAVGLSLKAPADADVLICKYDLFGNPIWQRTWGGPYMDEATDVVCDQAGNVYITGYTASPGGHSSLEHILLLKLNSAGEVVWEKTWSTLAMNATASGIALDADGNIYLGCNSYGTHDNHDLMLLKYDASGALVMQKLYATSTDEESRDIALDGYGNIYIAGNFFEGLGTNIAILKLTPAGEVAAMIGGGGDSWDDVGGIGLDYLNNLYVTGRYIDDATSDRNAMLLKYDANLDLEWKRHWRPTSGSTGHSVHLRGGFMSPITAFVTGYVFDTVSVNDGHCLLLEFDSQGNHLSGRVWSASVNQRCFASAFLLNSMVMAGQGDLNAGSWGNISGTAAIPTGNFEQMWFGTLEDVTGIQGTYHGTYGDIAGTHNTGGGDHDAVIMGWFPDLL